MEKDCPCGSGNTYATCCHPYISGEMLAPTSEKLMRSRYTAYAVVEIPYLMATALAGPQWVEDPAKTKAWAESVTFQRLEIIDLVNGLESDSEGIVEFKAWYKDKEGLHCMYERSTFKKEDQAWMYEKGTFLSIEKPPKIGRNEPCPCGSGKKYKKCCGS